MSEEKVQTAVKVTIGEKVFIIRTPENDDIENAMKMAHQEMGDDNNQTLYMYKMQSKLFQELLVSINGNKDVRKPIGELATMPERAQINKVIGKMTGMGNALTMTEEAIVL